MSNNRNINHDSSSGNVNSTVKTNKRNRDQLNNLDEDQQVCFKFHRDAYYHENESFQSIIKSRTKQSFLMPVKLLTQDKNLIDMDQNTSKLMQEMRGMARGHRSAHIDSEPTNKMWKLFTGQSNEDKNMISDYDLYVNFMDVIASRSAKFLIKFIHNSERINAIIKCLNTNNLTSLIQKSIKTWKRNGRVIADCLNTLLALIDNRDVLNSFLSPSDELVKQCIMLRLSQLRTSRRTSSLVRQTDQIKERLESTDIVYHKNGQLLTEAELVDVVLEPISEKGSRTRRSGIKTGSQEKVATFGLWEHSIKLVFATPDANGDMEDVPLSEYEFIHHTGKKRYLGKDQVINVSRYRKIHADVNKTYDGEGVLILETRPSNNEEFFETQPVRSDSISDPMNIYNLQPQDIVSALDGRKLEQYEIDGIRNGICNIPCTTYQNWRDNLIWVYAPLTASENMVYVSPEEYGNIQMTMNDCYVLDRKIINKCFFESFRSNLTNVLNTIPNREMLANNHDNMHGYSNIGPNRNLENGNREVISLLTPQNIFEPTHITSPMSDQPQIENELLSSTQAADVDNRLLLNAGDPTVDEGFLQFCLNQQCIDLNTLLRDEKVIAIYLNSATITLLPREGNLFDLTAALTRASLGQHLIITPEYEDDNLVSYTISTRHAGDDVTALFKNCFPEAPVRKIITVLNGTIVYQEELSDRIRFSYLDDVGLALANQLIDKLAVNQLTYLFVMERTATYLDLIVTNNVIRQAISLETLFDRLYTMPEPVLVSRPVAAQPVTHQPLSTNSQSYFSMWQKDPVQLAPQTGVKGQSSYTSRDMS